MSDFFKDGVGEPIWKQPTEEERQAEIRKELKEAMKDGVANMLTEGTHVTFIYEGAELSGNIRGITTMWLPLIGGVPGYIIELNDPSLVPPVVLDDFQYNYNYTCITVPRVLIDAKENEPK